MGILFHFKNRAKLKIVKELESVIEDIDSYMADCKLLHSENKECHDCDDIMHASIRNIVLKHIDRLSGKSKEDNQ